MLVGVEAYRTIIDEARAQVAAGRTPNADALSARIRATAGDDAARTRALKQLERVISVHRSRSLLARKPAPPPTPAPVLRRAALRTKPTITGNMDVRRAGEFALEWGAAKGVVGWEVRISERQDARADYAVRETLTLPAEMTSVELPLGDNPVRVHLLGRDRGGRLIRRAVISALAKETWNERWQRKASAS